MLKTSKPGDIDKFIKSGEGGRGRQKAKEVKDEKMTKYLLRIPEKMRREIRLEAIEKGLDMSSYICDILVKRKT